MSLFAALLLSLALSFASNVAATKTYDLTKFAWTLRSGQGNVSIPANVPSVAHMDLFKAGVIEEPVYGMLLLHSRDSWS